MPVYVNKSFIGLVVKALSVYDTLPAVSMARPTSQHTHGCLENMALQTETNTAPLDWNFTCKQCLLVYHVLNPKTILIHGSLDVTFYHCLLDFASSGLIGRNR